MEEIEVRNLYKVYNQGKVNEVRALDDVSFTLKKGELSSSSVLPEQERVRCSIFWAA